jgi:hypothetical protein
MSRRIVLALPFAAALALSSFFAWLPGASAETSCALTPRSQCFGFEAFGAAVSEEGGAPASLAGSHPYALTTSLSFDHQGAGVFATLDGSAKEIVLNLPRGLIVNPTATPERCTAAELDTEPVTCPESSAVGTITVDLTGPGELSQPIYNMVPPAGVPAQLAFNVLGFGVIGDIAGAVRTGGDYGLSGHVVELDANLISATATIWGYPAAESHDTERGLCEYIKQHGACPVALNNKPLLTMPGTCSGQPLEWTARATSWQNPSESLPAKPQQTPPVTGCGHLSFTPSLAVQPTVNSSDTPAGLDVEVQVPQNESAHGLATANLENAKVVLPQGFVVSPSAANGLVGCTEEQIELHGPKPARCPDAAEIGTVEVDTPLLSHPLPGAVYVAAPYENPFGGLLAIYVAVHDPQTGVVVKLAGHVEADEQTGQLTTTFDENPQLPFEDFKLDFFGGSRAVLATPMSCGSYTTTSVLAPWSGTAAAQPFSTSEITGGPGCHGQGFSPSLTAGTINNQAGAFSPLTMMLKEHDGEQALGDVSVTLPPGLLGVIKGVSQCPEPQASRGECTAASLLGEASAAVGPGEDPYWVTGGKVYLTGPYKGGPFGLSVVVPTTAGPFTLNGNAGRGKEVLRASIEVNPRTAQVSVATDASGVYSIPSILQGIPLQIRTVNVTVNRPGFTFNPTNCTQSSVQGSIGSAQGATAAVSSPFEAANCATLAFKPSFAASTRAGQTRRRGAFLHVNVGYTKGQANIAKVHVTLPKRLPARLETLKLACSEAQFATNPGGCPPASFVGMATAVTPVLAGPLSGPAIFVSHGGAAFPDLDLVLQGEGVTQILTGNTQVTKTFTSSTFKSVPDVPISSFELTLPEGPHSALGGNGGNLCKAPLYMPTTLTGQNGAVVEQKTRVAVTDCKAKASRNTTNRSGGTPGSRLQGRHG